MRLLLKLLLQIVAVILLCLAATTAWIVVDAHRGIERATTASAERAVVRLQALYWQKLLWRDGLNRAELVPLPEWRSLETARVVAPGVCIDVAPVGGETRRLCNDTASAYPDAPLWFGTLYRRVFGAFPTVRLPLDVRQHVGEIVAGADPETTLRLAWLQIGMMVEVAGVMAAAVGLFVAALVARALMPVRTIVAGLRRLEGGDYAHRLATPKRGSDFGRIAAAVDALSARLALTQAARDALTRQLFQVQEEERQALARDLHDEFGQCLAATGAFAGSIEAGAADRPDLVADARAIKAATRRMMDTLKEALVRLRSQDIDDLGLEACLGRLAATWSGRGRGAAKVHLDLVGDLDALPRPVAIGLYRIAQECLTNAARHGAARHIVLRVDGAGPAAVALSVEDDGGGDPDRVESGTGHGLVGIRERIAALGGSLAVGRAAQGIRVAATIPFAAPVGLSPTVTA